VEYAGGPFALFFLAEYSNIIFINALSVILFLGAGSPLQFLGWPQTLLVAIKITFLSFIFL
jgi:NADH:ubiquinone oxidoreductase subunit H